MQGRRKSKRRVSKYNPAKQNGEKPEFDQQHRGQMNKFCWPNTRVPPLNTLMQIRYVNMWTDTKEVPELQTWMGMLSTNRLYRSRASVFFRLSWADATRWANTFGFSALKHTWMRGSQAFFLLSSHCTHRANPCRVRWGGIGAGEHLMQLEILWVSPWCQERLIFSARLASNFFPGGRDHFPNKTTHFPNRYHHFWSHLFSQINKMGKLFAMMMLSPSLRLLRSIGLFQGQQRGHLFIPITDQAGQPFLVASIFNAQRQCRHAMKIPEFIPPQSQPIGWSSGQGAEKRQKNRSATFWPFAEFSRSTVAHASGHLWWRLKLSVGWLSFTVKTLRTLGGGGVQQLWGCNSWLKLTLAPPKLRQGGGVLRWFWAKAEGRYPSWTTTHLQKDWSFGQVASLPIPQSPNTKIWLNRFLVLLYEILCFSNFILWTHCCQWYETVQIHARYACNNITYLIVPWESHWNNNGLEITTQTPFCTWKCLAELSHHWKLSSSWL